MSKKRRVPAFGEFATRGLDEGTLTIAGKKLKVRIGEVPQSELLFFAENPRVHSLLHSDGTEPTQEEIQDQLEGMENVKKLVQDIRRNGGLIDALIVLSGSREVIEGNSRLAAYRCLAREDPIRWGKVKVTLLPEPVEGVVIDVLLGQYHLKGEMELLLRVHQVSENQEGTESLSKNGFGRREDDQSRGDREGSRPARQASG